MDLKKAYKQMLRIRMVEERIADLVSKGKLKTPCHLYIGEEAVAVGVCENLQDSDYVFSNYRGHGHFLAKGGNLKKLIAEVFCKKTGCSKGKGGSMHLVAHEIGIFGNTAIVAGQLAPGIGVALASKLQEKDSVSVIFFGDGAMEEGVTTEVLNFAALKKLPVLFVCENNFLAAHMRLLERQPIKDLYLKANYLMPSTQIDGNDIKLVYETVKKAVQTIRNGNGPVFIEALTFRHRGHVGPNLDIGVGRTKEELDSWMKKCPIKRIETFVDEKERQDIKKEIEGEIEEAVKFAEESPHPDKNDLMEHVYAEDK
jgi:pyruvate dehydrogenase E1 component alpha subunit